MDRSNQMNKIKCLECGTILESKHRHDWVTCGCPNQTFIDGGNDYLRYGGVDMNKIKVIKDYKKWSQTRNLAKGHITTAILQIKLANATYIGGRNVLVPREQIIVDRCIEQLGGVFNRWDINNEGSKKSW
jgi:hypothetical protein